MGGSFEHRQPNHAHVPDRLLARAATVLKTAGAFERLRLLECLRDGEACVTGLAEHLGQQVTTTSNQLQALARAGLVVKRRADRHRYYRLADARVADLVDLAIAQAKSLYEDSDSRAVAQAAANPQTSKTGTTP